MILAISTPELADVACVGAVSLKETDDFLADTVVACLGYECCVDACACQRYDGIECRAARHGADGLPFLEYDVENSLAYSYNFSHKLPTFLVCFN